MSTMQAGSFAGRQVPLRPCTCGFRKGMRPVAARAAAPTGEHQALRRSWPGVSSAALCAGLRGPQLALLDVSVRSVLSAWLQERS